MRRVRDDIERKIRKSIDRVAIKEATAEEDHGKAF
jgi:hypothetical protein